MARTNHNTKTLTLLKSWGWFWWGVEQNNVFSGKKSDLYNIIDYLVITRFSTIGVQSCGADFAPHKQKIMIDEKENTIKWLECENRLLILIGWRKLLQKKGGERKIFKPRIALIYILNGELYFEEKNTNFM